MTEKYHELDPMSDVISDDYRMLQMICRFGITLGFGNKTVGETCKAAGVDVTVVEAYKNAAALGEPRAQNIYLLGVLVKALGLADKADWAKIVASNVPAKAKDVNVAALNAGMQL